MKSMWHLSYLIVLKSSVSKLSLAAALIVYGALETQAVVSA